MGEEGRGMLIGEGKRGGGEKERREKRTIQSLLNFVFNLLHDSIQAFVLSLGPSFDLWGFIFCVSNFNLLKGEWGRKRKKERKGENG